MGRPRVTTPALRGEAWGRTGGRGATELPRAGPKSPPLGNKCRIPGPVGELVRVLAERVELLLPSGVGHVCELLRPHLAPRRDPEHLHLLDEEIRTPGFAL